MGRPTIVAYAPKQCEVCNEEFIPTSGRQRVCTNSDCQHELGRWRRFRAQQRVVGNDRPTEKRCDWVGCPTMIPVSWTGVLPKYCRVHYQQSIAPRAQTATSEWRLKTVDIPCSHPACENLQHPSAHGWCHYHYTIWTVHGLDSEGWWNFYNNQGGECPICGDPLLNGTIVAIDHDHVAQPGPRHKKEHARGLLHAAPCNSVIVGGLETAIANGWFENALRYIQFQTS